MDRDQVLKISEFPVYVVVISGKEYFFRQILIEKYINIERASIDETEFQDSIVMEALLFPIPDIKLLDNMYAGEFETLYKCIIKSSYFDFDKWQSIIDIKKRVVTPEVIKGTKELGYTKPLIPLIVQVCKAFPAYKPEDLFKMSADELLERVAWSELLLGNIKVDSGTGRPIVNKAGEIPVEEETEIDVDSAAGNRWALNQDQLQEISLNKSKQALQDLIRQQKQKQ